MKAFIQRLVEDDPTAADDNNKPKPDGGSGGSQKPGGSTGGTGSEHDRAKPAATTTCDQETKETDAKDNTNANANDKNDEVDTEVLIPEDNLIANDQKGADEPKDQAATEPKPRTKKPLLQQEDNDIDY